MKNLVLFVVILAAITFPAVTHAATAVVVGGTLVLPAILVALFEAVLNSVRVVLEHNPEEVSDEPTFDWGLLSEFKEEATRASLEVTGVWHRKQAESVLEKHLGLKRGEVSSRDYRLVVHTLAVRVKKGYPLHSSIEMREILKGLDA